MKVTTCWHMANQTDGTCDAAIALVACLLLSPSLAHHLSILVLYGLVWSCIDLSCLAAGSEELGKQDTDWVSRSSVLVIVVASIPSWSRHSVTNANIQNALFSKLWRTGQVATAIVGMWCPHALLVDRQRAAVDIFFVFGVVVIVGELVQAEVHHHGPVRRFFR